MLHEKTFIKSNQLCQLVINYGTYKRILSLLYYIYKCNFISLTRMPEVVRVLFFFFQSINSELAN